MDICILEAIIIMMCMFYMVITDLNVKLTHVVYIVADIPR